MGGLFGGGSSSSEERVTTTTTTTVGDIGLTGQNVVDLFAVATQGLTDRAVADIQTIETILQESGNNYNQLMGGANRLIEAAPAIAAGESLGESDVKKIIIPIAIVAGSYLIWKGGK